MTLLRHFCTLLVCLLVFNVSLLKAQEEAKYVPETDTLVLRRLEQWQDLKFGLLMHWGTYSQWGIVESWSICAEDEDWCRRPNPDYEGYKKEYENLKRSFPEKTEMELKAIHKAFFHHLCDLVAEFFKEMTMSKDTFSQRMKVLNPEVFACHLPE